jgi:hypothetical protein
VGESSGGEKEGGGREEGKRKGRNDGRKVVCMFHNSYTYRYKIISLLHCFFKCVEFRLTITYI